MDGGAAAIVVGLLLLWLVADAVDVVVVVAAVAVAAVLGVVVVAAAVVVDVVVVVGSDVDVNAISPRCPVCIGFYGTSCTRSAENIGVADDSCIMLRPAQINRGGALFVEISRKRAGWAQDRGNTTKVVETKD